MCQWVLVGSPRLWVREEREECQTDVRNVLEMIVPVSVTAITHTSPGWAVAGPHQDPRQDPQHLTLTLGDGQTRHAGIGLSLPLSLPYTTQTRKFRPEIQFCRSAGFNYDQAHQMGVILMPGFLAKTQTLFLPLSINCGVKAHM